MFDTFILGLNLAAWITIVAVICMFLTLIFTKLREDVAFLGVIAVLLISGVLDTKEALGGFSSNWERAYFEDSRLQGKYKTLWRRLGVYWFFLKRKTRENLKKTLMLLSPCYKQKHVLFLLYSIHRCNLI